MLKIILLTTNCDLSGMVTLKDKCAAVEEIYGRLDNAISSFQTSSHLHCKWGCGKCCFKPDIEATALEFLPLALHLFKQGQAVAWYDKLIVADSPLCVVLNPTQSGAGLCSDYPHRGLICRLFGYSARFNKNELRELITCEIIKTEQMPDYQHAEASINSSLDVPVMSQYYMQLHGVDADLAREFYPINKAILRALEVVLQYYAYRDSAED